LTTIKAKLGIKVMMIMKNGKCGRKTYLNVTIFGYLFMLLQFQILYSIQHDTSNTKNSEKIRILKQNTVTYKSVTSPTFS
jgi:hypothetical protein